MRISKNISQENPKHYFGKLCRKHPELKGERAISSRGCTACNLEKMRERRKSGEYWEQVELPAYKKFRQKHGARLRAKERERRTGFSQELVWRLLAYQAGLCPLCHKPFGKRFHADHCHDTKEPRGLLCGNCNRAEGMIRRAGVDPVEFGKRLAAYKKFPPARPYLKLEKRA